MTNQNQVVSASGAMSMLIASEVYGVSWQRGLFIYCNRGTVLDAGCNQRQAKSPTLFRLDMQSSRP